MRRGHNSYLTSFRVPSYPLNVFEHECLTVRDTNKIRGTNLYLIYPKKQNKTKNGKLLTKLILTIIILCGQISIASQKRCIQERLTRHEIFHPPPLLLPPPSPRPELLTHNRFFIFTSTFYPTTDLMTFRKYCLKKEERQCHVK